MPLTGLKATKLCRECKQEQSVECFYKHKDTKDRLRNECKTCINKSTTKYYFDNKDNLIPKRKAYHFKRKYNLSMDEIQKMREEQNFACRICKEPKELVVDHDHKTERVRGLLCRDCNLAVGYIRDNPEWPSKAIAYLEKYKQL